MATITGNFVQDNSTLANFKSWAMAISSAFSTFGWVQTADTGQVNWSTISTVTSVFEIWKSNDAPSSTLPIFVKVQYGFSTTIPRIQVQVGTNSDGAGNLLGQVNTNTTLTSIAANQGSTTFPCFFSGSPGEFRMWMWGVPNASPSTGVLFVIERSKDSSGNSTANYFTIVTGNQNSQTFSSQQTVTPTGLGNRDLGIITPTLTSGAGTGSSFGTVAAFPVFPVLGVVGNPMLGLMSVCAGDAAPNSTVTVSSMYGTTHTYLVVSGGNMSQNFSQRGISPVLVSGLMRFE